MFYFIYLDYIDPFQSLEECIILPYIIKIKNNLQNITQMKTDSNINKLIAKYSYAADS